MRRALIIRHHEAETMGADFRAVLERRGFRLVGVQHLRVVSGLRPVRSAFAERG